MKNAKNILIKNVFDASLGASECLQGVLNRNRHVETATCDAALIFVP